MDFKSPVVLADLPFCYLPFDHAVRKQIRKAEFAEKHRRLCKAARTGMAKLVFLDDYLRVEDLAREYQQ